ncbi:D-methionine transport system permease protein [Pelagirhabdus alkalitolerans]|uniref:D-methionine transport system permease protein n=1 Tax=Pelagirhabdus alkalitolerans TaxID=1612202 RepID=A0A1G6J078_9BACI|nr:methionine ABC transporter permease [Pelagirhabdus alkalitolerans]SDC11943.1 D-methionine transport system permease protein [Pelagirhabdus alkalitolerans]
MFDTSITLDQFIEAIGDTLYMVGMSLLIGTIFGSILGIVIVFTRRGGILAFPMVYSTLNVIINIIRSVPFIILMVSITPFTRVIAGTSIGTNAAIVPLIIFITPFIARLVENSLLEVGSGIVEAAESMGATPLQIIWHFILPEAFGSLILSLATATISLIGASAMAGAVGGGGVGDIAILYGYHRYDSFAIISTIIVLIIFVQFIQSAGNHLARLVRRR